MVTFELPALSIPESPRPAASTRRFPDGRAWRLEIPSVEGPAVLDAVLDEADHLGVPIDRVSQGSGITLLLDAEIEAMVARCAERDMELSLFVGPRGAWDIGGAVLAVNGGALRGALRGSRQLAEAVADVERAVALGVPSILVADIGLLALLGQRRTAGTLPAGLILKMSVLAGPANPAAAAVMAALGADSLNVPSDLTMHNIAEVRAATDAFIDFYVEATDDIGGFVRYHDVPELVRVAAPIYLKFGLRNSPVLYPTGRHLETVAVLCGRERVRRAAIGLEHLRRAADAAPVADATGSSTAGAKTRSG